MTVISPSHNPPYTMRRELLNGIRDTLPMMIGAAPFGIIFGASAVIGGLSPLAVIALSAIVFAGSSQFIGATLFNGGASLIVIYITTFIVNLRHALYSATLAPHYREAPQKWLIPLAFLLTDETFAVVSGYAARHPDSPYLRYYQAGSSIAMYLNWQTWTLIGVVAGTSLAGIASWGLDFAMTVTFLGIVIPLIVNRPMLVCATVAAVVAVVAHPLPNQLWLMLAAFAGISAGVLAERWQSQASAVGA